MANLVLWAKYGSLIGPNLNYCALIGSLPNRPPLLLSEGAVAEPHLLKPQDVTLFSRLV